IGLEMDAAFIGAKRMLQIQELIQKGGAVATDGSGCVEQVRMIKSAEEIEYIRKACRATEAGILAGVGAVRAGVTENQIAAAMFDATVGMGSTYMSSQPIVTSGPRSGVAHTTFDNRTVQQGDV